MTRISYHRLACTAALTLLVSAGITAVALATPTPTSAVIHLNVFHDCLTSSPSAINNYPGSIFIGDANLGCTAGFKNLHTWSFSTDGVTYMQLANNSSYKVGATLVIDGATNGEGGLRLNPWYSPDDNGQFNCRLPDGEIACFGGRMPFYTFTGHYGLHYVRGTAIYLEMDYLPNGLSAASPATMEYRVVYNGGLYDSGPQAFDMANPAEDPPHGLWGELTPAYLGGYLGAFIDHGNPNAEVHATWTDIKFINFDAVPTQATTWGKIKSLYR